MKKLIHLAILSMLVVMPKKGIAQSKKNNTSLQNVAFLNEVFVTGAGIPINKNIVESAVAASLYKAQGASAVIQLFTKGNTRKISISFSKSITATQLLNNGDVHQSKFHAFTTNDYIANAQYNPLSPTGYANNSASTTGEIYNVNNNTSFQNFIAAAIIKTNFKKDFKSQIPLMTSTQIAFDYRKNKYKHFVAYGYNASNYSPWNVSQAGVYKIAANYTEPFITYGFLINQRFDYNKNTGLFIEARSDLSSAFGSGSKAQTFSRTDAYINLSKLNFWLQENIYTVLKLVKLRIVLESAGSQPCAFQHFPISGTGNFGSYSQFVFSTQTPNKNLTAKILKETEFGIDKQLDFSKKEWFTSDLFSFTKWSKKTLNGNYYDNDVPSTGIGIFLDNVFGLRVVFAFKGLSFYDASRWDIIVPDEELA